VPATKSEDYIGKSALAARREQPARRFVGLAVDGNEAPASGDAVMNGRAQIGVVTSATRSAVLRRTIALARLDAHGAGTGGTVEIGRLDGQQKRLRATICALPFYDPQKARVRA